MDLNKHHPHTTDETGYDFMANHGQEEQDRDTIGIIFAVSIIAIITLAQYLGAL